MTQRTEAQKEASRVNGARSKGPVTPEGKSIVSQNAVTHGMRAASVVLKYENVADWEELLQDLTIDWKPSGITQTLVVRDLADAYWRLTRVKKMETRWLLLEAEGCEEGIRERCPSADNDLLLVSSWDILQTSGNSFDRLQRYEAQIRRTITSSIKNLVSLQATAGRRAAAPSPAAEQPQETAPLINTIKPEALPVPEQPSDTIKPEIAAAVTVPPVATPPNAARPVQLLYRTAGRQEAA